MRIELGSVKLVLDSGEDVDEVLRRLLRHFTNKEIAALLGVSERTVRRWKEQGRLPSRGSGQITLLELLRFLGPTGIPQARRRKAAAPGSGTAAAPA